ncbi:2-phospho-L-lactate transferase [Starkeya sp. ORNL1]|uniref:2-phospho-L-lactate transferase n=1 Tax=Starkeya sp. ORNL1 TaxID=2709380 RepID=UPI0014630991|nr:2-phospho-L-lactate transferase [Starkeya sp. ORNL1]QJP13407.1 2-phospho-L-lactate transferase [Starkeya sp. ORNL1]
MSDGAKVVALSGGIGGAKLALGLDRLLPACALTVVANTGDDFNHLGLHVSPDIDTLLYTLAGLDDPTKGWGRRDETWTFMKAIAALGGESWFLLGDGDLATHVERTRRLGAGETLSMVTEAFRQRFGIASRILPMSDDAVRTRVRTDEGWLDFQHYFVRRRCEPAVEALEFTGAVSARMAPDVAAAIADPALAAIIICPSNPYLSVDPILAVPGMREALRARRVPALAVSPIIAGQAVKGPTAKMMAELGLEPSAATVARHYEGLIDGLMVDALDADVEVPAGMRVFAAATLMRSLDDRIYLARTVLAAVAELAGGRA